MYGMDEVGGINAAGVLEDLRFVPADWLDMVVSMGSTVADGGLRLKPERRWINMRAAFDSAQWMLISEETEHGTLWKQTLRFDKTKNLPMMGEWLTKYAGVPLVFVGRDRNGFSRLVGTREQPMLGLFVVDVGQRPTQNKTTLDYAGVLTRQAGLLIGPFDDATSFYSANGGTAFGSLLDRVAALESKTLWFQNTMFMVIEREFSRSEGVEPQVLEVVDVPQFGSFKVLDCSLNGVAMGVGTPSGSFADLSVTANGNTGLSVVFNADVTYVGLNIVRLLVQLIPA